MAIPHFDVQATPCATCIYRTESPLDLTRLEAEIADPHMPGHFAGYRICHHSDTACCAGFWARHKDDFPLGQVAQRLGLVEYVNDDTLRRGVTRPPQRRRRGIRPPAPGASCA